MSIAKFSLFRHDGLKVWFEADAPDALALNMYIDNLMTNGFALTEGGLENDEKVEAITGWVYGARSDGQPLVWLYADPLDYKVATVWQERLDEMPFNIAGARQWSASAAPKAEEARAKGFMNEVAFEIVMKQTGKFTEAGRALYDFDRVRGDVFAGEHVTGASGENGLITADQLKTLNTIGRKVYGKEWDDKRPEIVAWKTNDRTRSSRELSVAEADGLITGLEVKLKKMPDELQETNEILYGEPGRRGNSRYVVGR